MFLISFMLIVVSIYAAFFMLSDKELNSSLIGIRHRIKILLSLLISFLYELKTKLWYAPTVPVMEKCRPMHVMFVMQILAFVLMLKWLNVTNATAPANYIIAMLAKIQAKSGLTVLMIEPEEFMKSWNDASVVDDRLLPLL